jgi:hypothetical protein
MRNRYPALLLISAASLAGCGDDPADGADAAPAGQCELGSDRYLPFEPGMHWTYQVTELDTGERETKEQTLEAVEDPELGPVIQQTTGKRNGSTVSLFRVEGDRVLRLEQLDLDATGTLERTTRYDPGQIRIDESPSRLTLGATWEEAYDETEIEPGLDPVTVATVDAWEVISVDAVCEAPLGNFSCLHLRRTRTAGGVAVKDFHFARGLGKVIETGDNQTELLAGCGR